MLDLRSGPLERQSLPVALETLSDRFARETGITVTTNLALGSSRLPARSEEALYRIVQEALSNVRHHAEAGAIQIDLRLEAGQVQLTIADDGRGFAAEGWRAEGEETALAPGARAQEHGFGLIGMRERAHLLNGTMQIRSCPGAGTQVEVRIPLDEQRPLK